MQLQNKINEILPYVSRPTRYIGGEVNSVLKENPSLKVALAYPDVYEIGSGNLAIQLFYEILNERTDFQAERVFAPWMDFEKALRENNLPLYTLESFSPLYEIDAVAFNLPFELVYTNILNMLDLGQIPLLQQDRKGNAPFIIGGGPALANPEPIAPFFDLFFLGEGERAIVEILEIIEKGKRAKLSRDQILKNLSQIPGAYVPSLCPVEYEENGFYLKEVPGFRIQKRIEPDLNHVPIPVKSPVPWLRPVHDKGTLELMRGCYHRCRFCQAGTFYKPVRERNPAVIQEAVREMFKNQGIRDFSLMSLSSGDYSLVEPLLKKLNEEWKKNFVSFYLPSLRINSFNLELLESLNEVKKTGLTLAVEAGSGAVRKFINKEVSDEKLLEIVGEASSRGWRVIKLYFMLGMTDDLEEEKNGIIELLKLLSIKNPRISFNVSINLFIPKPMTPLQWRKIYTPETIRPQFREIQLAFKPNRKVKVRYQAPESVYLEGILARGNRNTATLILDAFQKGSRFDAWEECFDPSKWEETLQRKNPGFEETLLQENLDREKSLPWSFLDISVNDTFLRQEEEKAGNKTLSPGCQEGCLDFCGACNEKAGNRKAEPIFSSAEPVPALFKTSEDYAGTVGLVFEKTGNLKFLSQLDLLTWWEKMLIRAGIPLLFTEGFNPRPRMEFGFTFPVGMESFYENLRFQIGENLTESEIQTRIQSALPGLKISRMNVFETRPASLQSTTVFQDIRIKKVFIRDENLLSLIKNQEILNENEEMIEIRLPLAEKIRKWEDRCDLFTIQRLKLLTQDKKEVV
jgi:radical SAM family uncharacterized protein/radical SAM-linked protein